MIIFHNVSAATLDINRKTSVVLTSANLRIPSNRCIALVGPSEADKRAIVDLICGMKLPAQGRIIRKARVSFPVGSIPGVQPSWSLKLIVGHVARLYGQNEDEIVKFVQRICNRTRPFQSIFSDLTKPERRWFAQIVAFSIPFDTYILPSEEMTPDCLALFEARARSSGMIVQVRNMKFAQAYCDSALLVEDGKLQLIRNAQDVLAGPDRQEEKLKRKRELKLEAKRERGRAQKLERQRERKRKRKRKRERKKE